MTEASVIAPPSAETPPKPPNNSLLSHIRYVAAENPVTGLSFGLFAIIALCALIGPYIAPFDPLASDTSATLQPPSLRHLFGTDLLGRDIFSRTLYGGRISLFVGLSAAVLSGLIGTAIG